MNDVRPAAAAPPLECHPKFHSLKKHTASEAKEFFGPGRPGDTLECGRTFTGFEFEFNLVPFQGQVSHVEQFEFSLANQTIE